MNIYEDILLTIVFINKLFIKIVWLIFILIPNWYITFHFLLLIYTVMFIFINIFLIEEFMINKNLWFDNYWRRIIETTLKTWRKIQRIQLPNGKFITNK